MLDDLYSPGIEENLLKALDAFDVVQAEIPDGVRLYVEWEDGGLLKMDCSPTNVHFLTLNVTPKSGRYTQLCNTLPSLFKAYGVDTFTASPLDEHSSAVLKRRGSWQEINSGLIWIL